MIEIKASTKQITAMTILMTKLSLQYLYIFIFYWSFKTKIITPNAIKDATESKCAIIGAIRGRHCTIVSHPNPNENAIRELHKRVYIKWKCCNGAAISGF